MNKSMPQEQQSPDHASSQRAAAITAKPVRPPAIPGVVPAEHAPATKRPPENPKPPEPELVPIADIDIDPSVQMRVSMCETTIEEYCERMKAGDAFPPILVVRDDQGRMIVADGFHRLAAAKKAGLAKIRATVRTGGRREAIWYAIGANGRHGLRLTNADKRKAVLAARHEFPKLSGHQLAKQVGVSQPFVSKLLREDPITVITPAKRQAPRDPGYSKALPGKQPTAGEAASSAQSTAPKSDRGKIAGSKEPVTEVATSAPASKLACQILLYVAYGKIRHAGLSDTKVDARLWQLCVASAQEAFPEFDMQRRQEKAGSRELLVRLLRSTTAIVRSDPGMGDLARNLEALIAEVRSTQ